MAAALLGLLLTASVPWGHGTVSSVALHGVPAADEARLTREFAIAPGQELSRLEIRHAVQALLASGLVEDVRVEATPEADGYRLDVTVQPASRLSAVTIRGLPGREERRVAQRLDLAVGQPLHVAAFLAALDRAKQSLRAAGYPEATLDPDLRFDSAGQRVDVLITGRLGPGRTVLRVGAPGAGLSTGELWRVAGLEPGQIVSDGALQRARRGVAARLRQDGYWATDVGRAEFEMVAGVGSVVLPVERGPHFTLEVKGVEVGGTLLDEGLPFVTGEEPFEVLTLDATLERFRRSLQREGMLLARVRGTLRWIREGEEGVLEILVEDARRTPIEAVEFPGHPGVAPSELAARIGARPGRPWRWGREPVDTETLAADRLSVLETLRLAGYADAVVETPRIVARGGGVAVEMPIESGSPRLVTAIEVAGLPADCVRPELRLRTGRPWSTAAEEQDRLALLGGLDRAGYPDAAVALSSQCESGACSVQVAVVPGPRVKVGRVIVAGATRTRPSVVRTVAGIEEGSDFSAAARLDAQRNLLSLGIFERVGVRTIPGQTAGTRRGVLVDVQEGPSRAFGLGIGYDTAEKVRVSASWSELNLFGTGRGLFFESRFSGRERRMQLSYREPAQLGIHGFPTSISVYRSQEDYSTFEILRRGMWIEVGDRRRRPGRALLRYDYQIVANDAAADILSELERNQQNLKIASITPILEWDTRDDVFAPHRGVLATISLQTAFKAFIADASFEKLYATAAGFVPVGRSVFAASLRAGAIQPGPSDGQGESPCGLGTSGAGLDNLRVPISVRFFAGGRISHRAFPTDRLGIPCQTLDASGGPVGGAGLLLSSVEYRFPVAGAVGGELFVDGGNLWPAWRDIDPGGMRWGAGIGLRVETPVGPLRLEYGWKLDRRTGESPGELFLSLGNPF